MMTTRHRNYHDSRLMLDSRRRKLGGVCAGVARYLEIEPVWVRLAALIALFVCPQVVLLGYGIAYLVLEED